ncbi:MAG: beta-ketoacyl-[acyl-carrier-protein] synthase family protein [Pseudomonadota bacterium]
MTPLAITHYTLTSALGVGLESHLQHLQQGKSGLTPCDFPGAETLGTWVGEVDGLPDVTLPEPLSTFDCRNNRLAWLGLQADDFREAVAEAAQRYGAGRVAVFIGTSTSGIQQTELVYRELGLTPDREDMPRLPDWYHYEGSHNTYSVAEFVRRALALRGISSAISTACSSSAKVFASAHRAMAAGLCDAAVVGGVDSLCLTTLHGFQSLQLVATDVCRPSDAERQGLSIGEAAGFALLQHPEAVLSPGPESAPPAMQLLGYGESSDAHHMSSPHPEGAGAYAAMREAMQRAHLSEDDIDYINLHGTGTRTNDLVESLAVQRLFSQAPPCSSTKGFTGHTLGAAGIVEAVIAMLALAQGFMPESLNTRQLDPDIDINILLQPESGKLRHILSNSFGFGGSNCSLVLAAAS